MPELTVLVPLGDRDIEMRKPTDGALVVLSRTFRALPKIENVGEITEEMRNKLVRDLGTLGKIVEAMIVQETDKGWLDDAMIDGKVTAEDVFDSIRVAGEKLNGLAPAKAVAPVRRSRSARTR
jgi:hypothetical protein